jgi:hypothetical protein
MAEVCNRLLWAAQFVVNSVADPDHFDTDQDPAFHLTRIRVQLFGTDTDPYRF